MIVIVIYLLGCVVSYLLLKKDFNKEFGKDDWTVSDRGFAISISLLSWVGALAAIIHMAMNSSSFDKKAKW